MLDTLVDVLIPVFNAGKTVRSAVESVQHQTCRDIRIVVVDDGSTDDTPLILAGMAASDPRIEVFRRPNGGIVDALNFGLSQCRSKFLARQDGDDLSYPDRFAKQLAHLETHDSCIAVGGAARHIDPHGRSLDHVVRLVSPDNSDPSYVPSREPYILHPFLMTHRAVVEKVGGYRYVFHAEDTDLYWRLQENGSLYNLDDVVGDYRMHPDSVSSTSVLNGRISALNSQLAAISALRRRQGLPDLEFSKGSIGEYLAAASMQNIFGLGARDLSTPEADQLELSLAGKLMELASYRPFELDLEDCRFIRTAMQKHAGKLAPANRSMLLKMCSGAAVRLIGNAEFNKAMALVQPRLYAGILTRLAFRTALPRSTQRAIYAAVGRESFFK